jgi:hypothetical protein
VPNKQGDCLFRRVLDVVLIFYDCACVLSNGRFSGHVLVWNTIPGTVLPVILLAGSQGSWTKFAAPVSSEGLALSSALLPRNAGRRTPPDCQRDYYAATDGDIPKPLKSCTLRVRRPEGNGRRLKNRTE